MKTAPKQQVKPASIDETINGSNNKVIVPTIKHLTDVWVYKANGKLENNGGNDNSSELSKVAFRVIDNFEDKPFSINDFILSASYLDLSFETVTNFFNDWILLLNKAGRIQIMRAQESAYEWDSYYFIN